MKDTYWMEKAINLAKKGGRNVCPNPRVGAVLVEKGKVIGKGYHVQYGGIHAERAAIDDACRQSGKKHFPNATLYCTLEPCCYNDSEKQQPPCTEAIIQAGIGRVLIAHLDPNPRVHGRGIAALKAAGCNVRQDILKKEAAGLNPGFITRMKTGHPLVTLKMAMSLDGCIASATGDSKWISSTRARTEVHAMRAENDAVLVGAGTVLTDNPKLTVRDAEGPDPLRIIMDSRLSTPLEYHVASTGSLFFCGNKVSKTRIHALQKKGALVYKHFSQEKYPIEEMLCVLGQLGVNRLLVEGGSRIFTSFVRQNLYQRLELFTAPLFLGKGVNGLGDLGITCISEGHGFVRSNWTDAGEGNIRFSAWREVNTCLPD